MRTILLPVTVCGLVLAVASFSLANDFEALLQDLSFGNDVPPAATVTLDSSTGATADAFNPGSEGLVMPGRPSPAATASAPLVAFQSPEEELELQPVQEESDVDFSAVFDNDEAIASDDALAPVAEDPAVKALSEPQQAEPEMIESTLVQVNQPSAAPLLDAESVPAPQPIDGSMEMIAPIVDPMDMQCCGNSCGGCDYQMTCMPHLPPNLPHSTILQYFRSNKCYSNVWDGYRQHCGLGHHHVHGTCDCFKSKHGGCANCDSCDSCNR